MTGRDRIVLMVIVVLAVVGAGWMLVVSPERKEANSLEGQVVAAQSQLSTAEGQLNDARAAQSQYASAYASVVSLGKAVPADQEVPSLIYELAQATNNKHVAFNSITTTASGSGSATPASAPAATPTAGAAATAAFTQMPFTFIFDGGFFDLEHLFRQLTAFTTHDSHGGLRVSGRLLTLQSVKLTPDATGSNKLTGTITATAYVLPASQSVTGGATPSSPTGASTPASSTAAAPATAPAVVRVTP
jgi:Tfp pilus assembly protein PilX